jgi:hypothetical protein
VFKRRGLSPQIEKAGVSEIRGVDCPCRSSILMTRSASGKGNGRSNTAFTTLKIKVVAPMPKAKARAAANVNPGCDPSARRPIRKS